MRLAVDLDRSPDSAARARHALAPLQGSLSDPQLHDLRLLVSELVTNSVRHAGLGDEDQIRLEIVVGADALRVEVLDRGRGFVPREPSPDMERGGGWGLYLVEELADRWGVETQVGTRVWFELDRAA
jgi:anti-sigma regulatory factor (Ser/Thr protein kinase)